MIEKQIVEKIQTWANSKILNSQPVLGGSISKTELIKFENNTVCFLKTGSVFSDSFIKEANGLKEIKKANCIRTPEVYLADEKFLLMEYIEQGLKDQKFYSRFGEQLAKLHSKTSLKFGFREDNYIGSTPQINIPVGDENDNWVDFYYNKRLLFQYKLAEKNKLVGDELKNGFLILENRIEEILEGSEEKPSLLHGDLWSGNYLCDSNSNPVLIDPAIYYGHREADIAMTKMFGGFPDEFYYSYRKNKPLPQGFDYRENIYLLYHVLNHLNLFGSSYYGQAVRLVWFYLH